MLVFYLFSLKIELCLIHLVHSFSSIHFSQLPTTHTPPFSPSSITLSFSLQKTSSLQKMTTQQHKILKRQCKVLMLRLEMATQYDEKNPKSWQKNQRYTQSQCQESHRNTKLRAIIYGENFTHTTAGWPSAWAFSICELM